MRTAFSAALVRLAKNDPNVLLLTGDHGYALFDDFRKECPNQYINAGIAEQNMVGMAAGLAKVGFRPFVYGLAAFVPIRVIEQIKLDVAYSKLPVIFVGDGAGFVYSHLGSSHQSTEDIACTRAIPNLTVYSPADRFEMTEIMNISYQSRQPVYLRMGKSDCGDVHCRIPQIKNSLLDVTPPRLNVNSFDIAFIATGSLVHTAVNLATKNYLNSTVWSVPIIKPIDEKQITNICKQHQFIVVMEEHSVFGGLGAIISEISSKFFPLHILRIGVQDRFSHHCGTYEYLLKEHKLDFDSIKLCIDNFIRDHIND